MTEVVNLFPHVSEQAAYDAAFEQAVTVVADIGEVDSDGQFSHRQLVSILQHTHEFPRENRLRIYQQLACITDDPFFVDAAVLYARKAAARGVHEVMANARRAAKVEASHV